ncbi:MAG: dTDP-4-amino-4,6-dideoxyglucose formyltransferase [Bacteroidetes bacterium]|nr:dTDP-4-amino-4,6-dideoxyglucose formyltransferase [Bacteroidota bacterium]
MKKRVLVVSDNVTLCNAFQKLIAAYQEAEVVYAYSYTNKNFLSNKGLEVKARSICIKEEVESLVGRYDLILSLHCKQLFPAALVKAVKCINVHPGFNPYNRGWFPQVFSILNGMPFGATIHEIDELLDHGGIIAQRKISGEIWETSMDIYNKIVQAEIMLLEEFLPTILNNTYTIVSPTVEGNVNLKKDFNALCHLDLSEAVTMGQAIHRLRALTHGDYKNAWFEHPETGEKIYVSINLEKEEKQK